MKIGLYLAGVAGGVLALMASACGDRQGPERPWRDLVRQLADPGYIARLDVPASHLVSSAGQRGGNDDYNHYCRKGPEGWWVLADVEGAGYISRMWMTGVEPDHQIRIYLDGERKPWREARVDQFFVGGLVSAPPLAGWENGCWYSYVPITFKRRVVVMAQAGAYKPDGWPRLFYQINYTLLTNGPPYARTPTVLTPEDRRAIDETSRCWQEGANAGAVPDGGEILKTNVTIAAGQRAQVLAVSGGGVLRQLQITPDFSALSSAVKREDALRQITLRAYWDGLSAASVEAPLGAFFGSFWRRVGVHSLYIAESNGTFRSRFPMPFRTSGIVEIENSTDMPISFMVDGIRDVRKPTDEELGYFHGAWRMTGPDDVGQPHRLLSVQGRGRYAGLFLAVTSLDASWWILEGNESIRRDGEAVPGWLGTGLEDYFNCGWYYRNVLNRPLHGLVYKVPFRTIQYRIHLPDAVTFDSGLDAAFERGPADASHGWLESMAYYYLDRPQAANTRLPDPSRRSAPADPFEAQTIVQQVLSYERSGDFAAADGRIASFLEKVPDYPQRAMLELRQIACRGRTRGWNTVAAELAAYQSTYAASNVEAVTQAAALAGFCSGRSNALLGAYCNAQTRVYVDGRLIVEADDPERLSVGSLSLQPGRHVIAIQARWTRMPPWVQVCLLTHFGDITSDLGWRYSRQVTGQQWKALDYDDSTWSKVDCLSEDVPEKPLFNVEANGFAGMQSLAQGMTEYHWSELKDTVWFRRVFDIPASP